MTAPATIERRSTELAQLRELLLIFLVVTVPLAMGTVLWFADDGANDFNRRVSISPFDIALALLLVVAVAERRRVSGWRQWTWVTRIAVALAAVLAVALVVHPSPRGFDFAFRVLAGLAVIDAFVRLSRPSRQRVLAAIVIVGAIESVIDMAQSIHGGALGLGPLEYRGFFYTFGSSTAGHGGFDHPYHLAFFLLVAIGAAVLGTRAAAQRTPWLVGAAACSAGIATTYSRAALLSLLAFVVLVLVAGGSAGRKRSLRLLAAAVVIGFTFGAVAFGDGWHAKGQASTGAGVDSDRHVRAQEALRLIDTQPIFGVGPGRYTIALDSVEHAQLLPAHNIVLHEAAEAGVFAGVLTALLLLALLARSWRGGVETTAVFVLPALFLVLDAYPYVFPTGLAVGALWLGMLFSAREHLDGC
jgi:O-antigen ligase